MQALPDAVSSFQSLRLSVFGFVPPKRHHYDDQYQRQRQTAQHRYLHEIVGQRKDLDRNFWI